MPCEQPSIILARSKFDQSYWNILNLQLDFVRPVTSELCYND